MASSADCCLSHAPCEIRAEIYRCCDALTRHLNWVVASIYLPTVESSSAPTPIEVWIAVLQSDWHGDITSVPLVAREANLRNNGGQIFCVPDASILCKFIQSKTMLKRIIETGLCVPCDVFDYRAPSNIFAVHATMRHMWLDLVNGFVMPVRQREDFAIYGSHWDYFQHLATQRPGLICHYNDFFDCAARNGELDLLKRLPSSVTGTKSAMDWAAKRGHLDVLKWLHINRTSGCSLLAMSWAAEEGHFEVVKFLFENRRREGNIRDAIDSAQRRGHVRIMQYLSSLL